MLFHELAKIINHAKEKNAIYSNFVVYEPYDKLVLFTKGNSIEDLFFQKDIDSRQLSIFSKELLDIFCKRFIFISNNATITFGVAKCGGRSDVYDFEKLDQNNISDMVGLDQLNNESIESNPIEEQLSMNNIIEFSQYNIFEDFNALEWSSLLNQLSCDDFTNLIIFYKFTDSFTANYSLSINDLTKSSSNLSLKSFLSRYYIQPYFAMYWNNVPIERILVVSRLFKRITISILVNDITSSVDAEIKKKQKILRQLKSDNENCLNNYNITVRSYPVIPSQVTPEQQAFMRNTKNSMQQQKDYIQIISNEINELNTKMSCPILLEFRIGFNIFDLANDGLFIYNFGKFVKHLKLKALISDDQILLPGFCAILDINSNIDIHPTKQSLNPCSDEFKINSYFKKVYYHYYKNQIDKLLIQRDNILFENNIAIKDFAFWKSIGYDIKSYNDWKQTSKYEESFKYRYFYNYQYIQCSKCSKWRELDLFQYFLDKRQNQDQIILELNSFLDQEISCDNKYIKNRYYFIFSFF